MQTITVPEVDGGDGGGYGKLKLRGIRDGETRLGRPYGTQF